MSIYQAEGLLEVGVVKQCDSDGESDHDDAESLDANGASSDCLDTMFAYYAAQQICSESAWAVVVASLQKPWLVTARMNSNALGWSRHTLASLPGATLVADFPCSEALLLGKASDLLPDAAPLPGSDRTVHSELIRLCKTGELCVQELASMLPAILLDVRPEHCVLDLCAAPGSKTLHMLDNMFRGAGAGEPPAGLLIANDVAESRLRRLVERAKPLPCSHLLCTCFPAHRFPTMLSTSHSGSCGGLRTTWTKPSGREPTGQFKLKFDRVLCDVPCSSDGGVRKGVRKAWAAANGLALHVKQLGILLRGFELLAPGGRLVYSTCSLNPIENEAVLAAALAALGGRQGGVVDVLEAAMELGPSVPCTQGVGCWKVPDPNFSASRPDGFFDSFMDVPPLLRGGKIRTSMFPPLGDDEATTWIRAQLLKGARVLPGDQMGGFFLAVLVKRAGNSSGDRVTCGGARNQAGGQQSEEQDAPPAISANSRVTVRSTGDPATVIGPGAGHYDGLVKIRYPDRSTYHVAMADLDLAESPQREKRDRPEKGDRPEKAARKPGSRLLRGLSEASPNLLDFAAFFGLYGDTVEAASAGVAPFPWASVCFRNRDRFMLHLASPALLALRGPATLRPVSSGSPLLALCSSPADRLRWGERCPVRPCLEAAALLARCASKRRLVLSASVFARLLQPLHGPGAIAAALSVDELRRLEVSGHVSGFHDAQSQEGRGAVVVVLRQNARAADAVAPARESHVAVVGVLCTEGGLEAIVASEDVRSRLVSLAEMEASIAVASS